MKRSAFAAVVLAAGILLSGCSKESEETTKKKKKVKKTTQETTEVTEAPSESTDEPTESTDEPDVTTTTSEPDDTTMTTDTVPVDTTSDPGVRTPNPTFDFEEDAMSYFADDALVLPEWIFTFVVPETGAWTMSIQFYGDSLTFEGSYESTSTRSSGQIADVSMCNFSGTYDGFTRTSAYTFTTHVTSITFEEFDMYSEESDGVTTNYSFVEPYGFDAPDELTLYLPNTPMSEFPGYAIGRVGHLIRDKEADYLQDFVLYNTNGGVNEMALIVAAPGMPELVSPTADSMSSWVGHYYDKTGFEGSIEYDSASDSYVFNGTVNQSLQIEGAKILQAKDDELSLVFYYETDAGYALVQMEASDGLVAVYTLYSTIPELETAKFYYPSKDG